MAALRTVPWANLEWSDFVCIGWVIPVLEMRKLRHYEIRRLKCLGERQSDVWSSTIAYSKVHAVTVS